MLKKILRIYYLTVYINYVDNLEKMLHLIIHNLQVRKPRIRDGKSFSNISNSLQTFYIIFFTNVLNSYLHILLKDTNDKKSVKNLVLKASSFPPHHLFSNFTGKISAYC